MKRTHRLLTIFGLILMFSTLMSCSPGMPQGSEQDAGEVLVCSLTENLIGWRVTTGGKITFVDFSPPDGVYFEFEDGGCQAGSFAHNQFWNTFSDDQQQQITLGNSIQMEGILTKDSGRMIVSVQNVEVAP